MPRSTLIRLLLGMLIGLLPAVGLMLWLDEREWTLPEPWDRIVPMPSPFDGRWTGTATLFDVPGTHNCVWVPDIVLVVSRGGSRAKLDYSYPSTRPRTRSVASCPSHSSVTENPIETSLSGALTVRDGAGNTWSLVRDGRAMTGLIEPSTPGRPGSFYGEDVYISQELGGQDPRVPYRLAIMALAFGSGIAIVNGIERLRRSR